MGFGGVPCGLVGPMGVGGVPWGGRAYHGVPERLVANEHLVQEGKGKGNVKGRSGKVNQYATDPYCTVRISYYKQGRASK